TRNAAVTAILVASSSQNIASGDMAGTEGGVGRKGQARGAARTVCELPRRRRAISLRSERAAISSLPLKRGGMGWGSRPPPDRCAVDLPLSGGGVPSQPPSIRNRKSSRPDPATLLAWYDRHRRKLPWRAGPGERADPYRVWLSEIMLQQTRVRAVLPYYAKFLARWPDVHALAAAPLEEVLKVWAGLGYYARARNLHACAHAVVERHGGAFPSEEDGLRKLPGLGA